MTSAASWEPARITVVGLGELGEALVRTIASTAHLVPVVRGAAHRADDADWHARVVAAGGRAVRTAEEAFADVDLVVVCVPGTAALAVAEDAAAWLPARAIWADLSTAPPEVKETAARVVGASGARYADGAVLGAVAASGGRVPVLASGDGAATLADVASALGLVVDAFDGPPGAAARVKLLRSVYMKGRDALIAEMVLAADRYDLADVVTTSIRGPGEEVPFPQLVSRVLSSLERHATRRADELSAAAALLRASGVEPVVTDAAEARLRRVAERRP